MKKIIIAIGFLLITGTLYALSSSEPQDKMQKTYALEGEKMYAQMCAACHGATGLGEGKLTGTALNNQKFLSSVSDKDLFNYIKFGRVKALMPEYESVLTDEDIQKLTAFVRSWQQKTIKFDAPEKIAGNPENGERLYGLYCLSCHGESGQGKKTMGTMLANTEYLKYTTDHQIWISTAYGRDKTRMGPSLKGLDGVRQLTKQEISDVVLFIRGFQEK
ncbi:MAG TPA: cytochrome c [Bacillus bacterium]|nr:cytochrome c [Bacillus sp. (in: firmicutes)]